MSKQKSKLQRRIDRLTRDKHELLNKIERLLRERDDEPGGQENKVKATLDQCGDVRMS